MLTLYLLQATVPLALIAWLALAPPRSFIGFWTQSLATGVGLLAISMTGIWVFPPWWMTYVFAVLLLASVLLGLSRWRSRQFWPNKVLAWFSVFGFAALGAYTTNEIRVAHGATQAPLGQFIPLSSPLGPGVYFVANGGTSPSVNAHTPLLDQSVAQHRPYWGTAHGVDLIAIDGFGFRADGLMPAGPARYVIFGKSVIAPCAGEIVAALDGLPDMQVPEMDRQHLAGNHVVLRCSGVDILLGHFKKGSVLVKTGQSLSIGEAIAQVGNSGNTSEPHLHINAMKPGTADAPFSGEPIPIRINGQYLVRNDRIVVQE